MHQPSARQLIGFRARQAVFSGEEPGQNPRRQSGTEPDRVLPNDERGRLTFVPGATAMAARGGFWLISAYFHGRLLHSAC